MPPYVHTLGWWCGFLEIFAQFTSLRPHTQWYKQWEIKTQTYFTGGSSQKVAKVFPCNRCPAKTCRVSAMAVGTFTIAHLVHTAPKTFSVWTLRGKKPLQKVLLVLFWPHSQWTMEKITGLRRWSFRKGKERPKKQPFQRSCLVSKPQACCVSKSFENRYHYNFSKGFERLRQF